MLFCRGNSPGPRSCWSGENTAAPTASSGVFTKVIPDTAVPPRLFIRPVKFCSLLVERDYPGRNESQRAQRRAAEIYKYRLNDYDRALMMYQKLLENSITDGARIQYEIADTYFRQNNIEQARIEMESLLKNFPGSPLVPEALFRIAAIFALEGSLQDAEFIYRKLLEEHPDSPFTLEARFGLVSVLERKGELRAALNNLETLRGEYPKPGVIDRKVRQIKERIQKKKKAI
jgi:tetratricopeptide (TPR) repeat protein